MNPYRKRHNKQSILVFIQYNKKALPKGKALMFVFLLVSPSSLLKALSKIG
jgi:hypothetical protein